MEKEILNTLVKDHERRLGGQEKQTSQLNLIVGNLTNDVKVHSEDIKELKRVSERDMLSTQQAFVKINDQLTDLKVSNAKNAWLSALATSVITAGVIGFILSIGK